MWQQIAEWVKWLFQLTHETRMNREDIKDLRQEVKELSTMVQRLAYEIHRVTEKDDHEREKLQLKLDNQLLRFERRLTPESAEREPKERARHRILFGEA